MMKNLRRWKARYRAFRTWQRRSRRVDTRPGAAHDCASCRTHYVGNFCPQCGQSARIGRYSARTALLQFLDVWGLGNLVLLRTLRDLVLRPGYMIRDYLRGMQAAYFPPFKMLFLLTTLSIFVAYLSNLITGRTEALPVSLTVQVDPEPLEQSLAGIFDWLIEKQHNFPNVASLLSIGFLSLFFYLFFRRAKRFAGMRLSDIFIATVYSANMVTIYTLLIKCISPDSGLILLANLLIVIPMKQFTGYGWFRSTMNVVAAYVLILFVVLVGISVVAVVRSGVIE